MNRQAWRDLIVKAVRNDDRTALDVVSLLLEEVDETKHVLRDDYREELESIGLKETVSSVLNRLRMVEQEAQHEE